jgi:superfamily I DNA/RNA helicase
MSDADELQEAVDKVLRSTSRKKLVVAGPGAGKTTLFQKLLEGTEGVRDQRLVLTFINNLKTDLDRSLGGLAQVNTLHGYCLSLLYANADLREGLTGDLVCYPGLVALIKQDWQWLKDGESPTFIDHFRDLSVPEELEAFYRERASFYDAVDFDDTVYRVYRVYRGLEAHPGTVPEYKLVLIDEFQDFNKMEAGVIELLSGRSPITIAGDDDQALYSQLRGADWAHIRKHHGGGEYEVFELPFCMRCPEVVVGAINDIIGMAQKLKKLVGRISKPYRYFEPVKGEDSRRFPKIDLVRTTVQRNNANYFGRYIEEQFGAISADELKAALEKHEPAALIIGSKQYLSQIEAHLVERGLYAVPSEEDRSERDRALEILNGNPNSNLGWRIILGLSRANIARPIVRAAHTKKTRLVDEIGDEMRETVLKEAAEFAAAQAAKPEEDRKDGDQTPSIKLTSFEGSKGLSAQYVFLAGVHEGELPKKPEPQDIEICKFVVGLTRTKKKCSILITKNFAGTFKQPSLFLKWIKSDRFKVIEVNADYWKKS